ncbi:uncharacterized protein LOC135495302 [Lineus longissimus]|uniref:uncharacterized protein LOC135495302 n=1 Tax=Lineus longissimus TaxID=88925 RepID=UPI00315C7527
MSLAGGWPQFVTTVHVSYSRDGKTFEYIKDYKGQKLVFSAVPAKWYDVRSSWFPKPILLKIVRVHPVTHSGWPCLKAEYHGCDPNSGSTMDNFKIHTSLEFDPHNYAKNKFTLCHSQKDEFPPAYIKPFYCKGRPLARYVSLEKTSAGQITPLKFCELEVYGELFDGNLAYGKPSVQSSTYWHYNAGLAVDGDRRYNFTRDASCSQTLAGNNQQNWWSVDLGVTVDVGRVVVVVHRDCGCECLQKFDILITDQFDPKNVEKSNYKSCYSHPSALQYGQVKKIYCGPAAKGRYLVIQVPGSVPLTLCEVEVYERNDLGDNLALGKPCSQSSDGDSLIGLCDRANDGMRLTNLNHGSCTLTGSKMTESWWHVDLLSIYQIKKIVIVNRGDTLSDRLKNFNVIITKIFIPFELSKVPSTLCFSQHAPLKPGEIKTIYCPNRPIGRHVTIVKQQGQIAEPLTLCEVEVYGTPSENNLAWRKTVYQSSDLSEPTKHKAVDGLTSPSFFDGSCATTSSSLARQWWSVDLDKTYKIDRVVITNRADCCVERLRTYRIIVTSSLNQRDILASAYNLCSDKRSSMGGDLIKVKCKPGARGRFLTIVKDDTLGEPLTLCEVEVYGKEPTLQPGTNFALGKPTTDSNPYTVTSDAAVDGDIGTDISKCFVTPGVDAKEWWMVDVGGVVGVNSVVIATSTTSDKKTMVLTIYLVHTFSSSVLSSLGLKMVIATTTAPPATNVTTTTVTPVTTASSSGPIATTPTPTPGSGVRICGQFQGGASGGEFLSVPCTTGSSGQYILIVKSNAMGSPMILCEVGVYGPPVVIPPTTTTKPTSKSSSTTSVSRAPIKARKRREAGDDEAPKYHHYKAFDFNMTRTSLFGAGFFTVVLLVAATTIHWRTCTRRAKANN